MLKRLKRTDDSSQSSQIIWNQSLYQKKLNDIIIIILLRQVEELRQRPLAVNRESSSVGTELVYRKIGNATEGLIVGTWVMKITVVNISFNITYVLPLFYPVLMSSDWGSAACFLKFLRKPK